MPSQWLDFLHSFGMMSVFMLGVAGLMNDLSHTVYYSGNPIPAKKREDLDARYGRWAVETAIAVCPLGDMECIEREAKRLAEARLHRR